MNVRSGLSDPIANFSMGSCIVAPDRVRPFRPGTTATAGHDRQRSTSSFVTCTGRSPSSGSNKDSFFPSVGYNGRRSVYSRIAAIVPSHTRVTIILPESCPSRVRRRIWGLSPYTESAVGPCPCCPFPVWNRRPRTQAIHVYLALMLIPLDTSFCSDVLCR